MKAILKYSLRRRPKPTNTIKGNGFLPEGSVIDVDKIVDGDAIDKISTWYLAKDGFYYWGGGVRTEGDFFLDITTGVDAGKKDWWFADYKIGELWKFSKGEDITVAILDSGLNFSLTDFKNKANISYFNSAKNLRTKESCFDSSGHGTDCAGIVCAQGETLCGIAPNVNLIVIKTADDNGSTTTKSILDGLEEAVSKNVDIISVSFQIPHDANFENIRLKIAEAINKKITIVAAVGNSGELPGAIDNFPASFPGCLSIGGVDRNRVRGRTSSRSNFLALMCPGENLRSLNNPNENISGTSFSTPFAAGVIALLKSIAKKSGTPINNKELFEILKKSANRLIPNYNLLEYGWGIINPTGALEIIQSK